MRIEELAEMTSDLVNEGKGREKVVIDIGEVLTVLEEQMNAVLDDESLNTAGSLREELRLALNNFIRDEKEQEVDAIYDRGRLNLPTTYDY